MNNDQTNVVTLKEAAERLGISDLETVKRAAKNGKSLIRAVGGVFYVDTDALQTYLKEQVQKQAERMKQRKEKTDDRDQVGILMARAKMYPMWIAAKEKAVAATKEAVGKASNAYEKRKAQRELVKLQTEFDKMLEHQKTDKAKLDNIFNPAPEVVPIIEAVG